MEAGGDRVVGGSVEGVGGCLVVAGGSCLEVVGDVAGGRCVEVGGCWLVAVDVEGWLVAAEGRCVEFDGG